MRLRQAMKILNNRARLRVRGHTYQAAHRRLNRYVAVWRRLQPWWDSRTGRVT